MSDSLTIEGQEYISSRRAAKETRYTQDYIGQLCRGGHITARRVSGHWYVVLESLKAYKTKADSYKPTPPPPIQSNSDEESAVTFEGREYLSAARAAKLTGYNQDYIGQLARGGKIPSRQMGNRWFIDRDELLKHKEEKDALLAEVQVQAVGLREPEPKKEETPAPINNLVHSSHSAEPFFTYSEQKAELLPALMGDEKRPTTIEIHKPIAMKQQTAKPAVPARSEKPIAHKKRSSMPVLPLLAAALTIVFVITFSFTSLRERALYAFNTLTRSSMTASSGQASSTAETMIEWVEGLFSHDLSYKAAQQ